MRFIHISFWGIRASLVPFLLPKPVWRPLRLASVLSRTREREWTATGFLMTRPSLMSLRIFCLELALEISLISLGSNQTLFLPHFITEEASLFCNFNELIVVLLATLRKLVFLWCRDLKAH